MNDGDKQWSEKYAEGKISHSKNCRFDVGNVFQPVWLRHIIQTCFGFDRFILENRFNFLFHFNAILFALFIFKFKK